MPATYTVDIKRLTIKDMATLQRASTQGLELRFSAEMYITVCQVRCLTLRPSCRHS